MSKQRVLVTAGNTRVPIDKVRGLDNVFKGRTGINIAERFCQQGCNVTLLASHPHLVDIFPRDAIKIVKFKTYDELLAKMATLVKEGGFDAIVHSAAVADYLVDTIYAQVGEPVETDDGCLLIKVRPLDRSGKISSKHKKLLMSLSQTEKIVDKIRLDWGFKGKLVKFKLEVRMLDEELIKVATESMHHSMADFIVANTLEGMMQRAYIISAKGGIPMMVDRNELPTALYQEVFP